MTQRLQVLLEDEDFDALRQAAREEGIPVSEFVRRAVRDAHARRPTGTLDAKLRAVRSAATHAFPTAGIEDMLEETERGYLPPAA